MTLTLTLDFVFVSFDIFFDLHIFFLFAIHSEMTLEKARFTLWTDSKNNLFPFCLPYLPYQINT